MDSGGDERGAWGRVDDRGRRRERGHKESLRKQRDLISLPSVSPALNWVSGTRQGTVGRTGLQSRSERRCREGVGEGRGKMPRTEPWAGQGAGLAVSLLWPSPVPSPVPSTGGSTDVYRAQLKGQRGGGVQGERRQKKAAVGAPGERLGLRTHTHGERKGRGEEDSNPEREGPKGGGGGTDHRWDQPSRGSGSQEGQRMGGAQAHPFDENAHWQTRWDPTSAHRPGAALKSATSVRASSFKSALSFFSHWDPATLLSMHVSHKHAGLVAEPRRARVDGAEGSLGPSRREACGGPTAGASCWRRAGEGREGFRQQLGGPKLMGRTE